MSIPKFFEFTRPILTFMAKYPTEHSLREICEEMGKEFKLTEEEKALRLPGGSQTVLDNRVGWAKLDLCWAGLLTTTKRGVYKITEQGYQNQNCRVQWIEII